MGFILTTLVKHGAGKVAEVIADTVVPGSGEAVGKVVRFGTGAVMGGAGISTAANSTDGSGLSGVVDTLTDNIS